MAEEKRKVMVVAEEGKRESTGALQWALTHAILEQDEIILLHFDGLSRRSPFSSFLRRPSTSGATADGSTNVDFVEEMKERCRQAQPQVSVQVLRVEAEDCDKAAVVLSHTASLGVDLLVVGQPRRSSFLGGRLGGGGKSMDMVEYLIENSRCLCVGVQKKGQNAGYVLNTKTHKNFWLLA
ncbi:adenine nucleotide alpha hydrolases-like superfamily protein [Wolffia australiana]